MKWVKITNGWALYNDSNVGLGSIIKARGRWYAAAFDKYGSTSNMFIRKTFAEAKHELVVCVATKALEQS